MIIGHIPAGYIFGKYLIRKNPKSNETAKLVIVAGVLGAVAPDMDMLYFYLIDNRQTHHHLYWSHYPIVWFTLFLATFILHKTRYFGVRTYLGLLFCGGAIAHLILDTVVGDVWWFAPFYNEPFSMFEVPAVYKPWWLNFLLHWSFVLEISLYYWAYVLWKSQQKNYKLNNQ